MDYLCFLPLIAAVLLGSAACKHDLDVIDRAGDGGSEAGVEAGPDGPGVDTTALDLSSDLPSDASSKDLASDLPVDISSTDTSPLPDTLQLDSAPDLPTDTKPPPDLFPSPDASISYTWVSVSVGPSHACGIKSNGTLWCWGANTEGRLGDGTSSRSAQPVQEATKTADWVAVAAGGQHTCAIKTKGTLWCWGGNKYGELGDGTKNNRSKPAQVGITAGWAEVAGGTYSTCAVKTVGTLWCWGFNGYGQLGNGTKTSRSKPEQVGSAKDWSSVAPGHYYHTCAVKTGGTLWCWGFNDSGQLGNGSSTSSTKPVQAGTSTDWDQLTSGFNHTCGIKTGGTLWCWGRNGDGELGDGTNTSRKQPVQVGGANNWTSIASTFFHTCGARSDGTLWCWGSNYNGQLGDGTLTDRTKPVQEATKAADWSLVTGGSSHTCGIKTKGTVWCWGANAQGQLGDGKAWKAAPVKVLNP